MTIAPALWWKNPLLYILIIYLLSYSSAFAEPKALTILTPSGQHLFQVEVADTDEERAKGLMFRETLPNWSGMLFDFETEQLVSMWMKNTFISLDMLFIDNTGTIVAIMEKAEPESLEHISPGIPVRAVLELSGGTTERLGIKPGDTVQFPIFQ